MLKQLIQSLKKQVEQARPAITLFQTHRPAMRAWARYQSAISEAIGPLEADAYTSLIVNAAQLNGNTARILALTVPDQLPRISPEARIEYFQLLTELLPEHSEALPLIARTLPGLLGQLPPQKLRQFLRQGAALYKNSHQQAESFLRQESTTGRAAAQALQKGLSLEEVLRPLSLYARAHCGEDVQLKPGKGQAFSDGHHLYLPEQVARPDERQNFLVYRVLTALSAGYLEFRTFDLRLDQLKESSWPDHQEGESELNRFFRSFLNTSLARELFQIAEDARIEVLIRAEYPGVARDLDTLGPFTPEPVPEGSTSPTRILALLRHRLAGASKLEATPEEHQLLQILVERIESLKKQPHSVQTTAKLVQQSYPEIEALMKRAEPAPQKPEEPSRRREKPDFSNKSSPVSPLRAPSLRPEAASKEDQALEEQAHQRWSQEENLSPTEARRQLKAEARSARSGNQERTRIQSEVGGAVVPSEEAPMDRPQRPTGPRFEQDPDLLPGEKSFSYSEWDNGISDYKPGWVTVRERRLVAGSPALVEEILRRHRHKLVELRRKFEALKPQAVVRKTHLTDGSDLDLERVIEDRINARIGGERSDRLYTREERDRRDVAVAFLLDMSSSTNESADGSPRRIIDVERESLILTAEAVHALGDPFAIFGFSGYGRHQVGFYVAKDFLDPWDVSARARVSKINFKMENRDGAAIRHATARLSAWPARTRLLIVISDGKPLDCGCDHYYDRYAQEDTRMALREARQRGIHPFCITVDPQARSYLPSMFGEVAYTVIDRVELLPARLVQIYRRLAIG